MDPTGVWQCTKPSMPKNLCLEYYSNDHTYNLKPAWYWKFLASGYLQDNVGNVVCH